MISHLFSGHTFVPAAIWQCTFCITVGLVISYLLKRSPVRAHRILFLAMTASLIVPVAAAAVRHFGWGLFVARPAPPPVPQAQTIPELTNLQPPEYEPVEITYTQPTTFERIPAPAAAPPTRKPIEIPWRRIALWGWFTASLLLAARLLVTFGLGIRLLRNSRPFDRLNIQRAADFARAKLGVARPVQVLCSERTRTPIIWCWARRPVLLVPGSTRQARGKVDWISVLCHELAHFKRRDHITGLVAELAVAIFPWHPLLWWAKRRLVRLSEQACDDWVLATGRPGPDYAESLLDLLPARQMAFAPAVISSKKGLARRVRRILQDNCGNPRAGLLWALTASTAALAVATAIAFAQTRPAKPETPPVPTLSEVRELVKKNETAAERIKMDYTLRFERTGEKPEPTGRAGSRKRRPGRSYSHCTGTWAQNGVKQYAATDYFYGPNERAKGHLHIFDGRVVKRANRPDLTQWVISDISTFDWDAVSVVKLGLRPFEALNKLSAVLVPEYGSVRDKPDSVDGREAYVIDAIRPTGHVYFARIWIDAERGMPSKIEYYDQHPDSGGARLMSRIDSIKLHQLPNRAWVPVKGTRSLFFQNGGIIREHMSVDVLSIRTDPDVPDSLFSFEFPEGAKIYDVTTGHTFIQGQPQKTIDQVLQAAPKFIAGRVVDSNNVPVSGVVVKTVFHLTKSEDGKRGFRIINGHDRLSYITDNQGRFALQLEQDDSYDITFSSKNHAGFIAYDVPSGTGDLKVVLPEGGTVTGRVVRLENGRKVPVASVEVTAEHRLGNFTRLGFENNKKTITDSQGRFRFDHLRTRMRRYKRRSLNEEHTYVPRSWKISAEGTSTTIEFRDTEKIEEMELVVTADLGTPLPLLGKPLPQFGGINIQFNAKQTGDEKVLVCFWDMNQRPSRYCIRQLAERASHLKDKGVNIVAIQAAAVDENALNEWISKNHIPFPVGNIKADEEKTRLAWGVRSLPWLILTDTDHIVTAEGFQVNELAEQISAGAENPDPSPARAAPATPDTVSLANRKRAYEHYEGDDLIQRIKSRDQMDPESLITVRTLDHQGDPVPYCRITFVDRDEKTTRHFYETATDQNGYAYCDQIQDTFSIIAGAFDYVPETAVYRSQDRKIGTLYNCQDNRLVTVQWPPFPTGPGKVKGRVHDQYGQPLTKFKLQINQRKGERQDWSESYETFQYLEVEHPQGHFQLTDLAPGKYVCGVRAKYLAAYASQYDMDEFVIPEAPQAAVHKDIEVEAKELLYGQAVYQDGSPLEKGGYTLWFEKDPPERRSRWGGRRFSLRMEPHGVFRVALSRRERRDLFQCTGGYVDIRDHSGKIGQVHVDKLAKDPNNAPTFEFARKTPRHSLVGARMPKFADIDIDFTPDQAMGKPILVCFWDMNQRPSRYLLKELAEKAEDLKQHGLEVVCVQASIVNQKELDDWVEKNYMPFPVGMVRSNDKTTRFNWGAKSLPWLILTDKEHVVRAEGFGLEELDKRIKANRSNPVARAQTPPVKDLRLEGVPASTEEDYYKQAWKVFQGYDLNTLITSRDQKDPESLVTVRTVDHQGNPVPFCRIVFADRNKYSSHPFRETAADKDGYVYCDQIGGDFSIRAGAFYYVADTNVYRYEHKRMPKLYNAKDKPVITVRWDAFPTGTGKIRGAVADQFGKPLKKFTLKINQIIKGQRRGKGEFHIAYHRIKVEHPQGHFQLADLAPGTYTYTVRAEDYLAYVSEFDMGQFTIPLQPNSTLKLDIEVEARACLYGQAVYDDGTMLRKGGFTLWGPEESRDYIYTIPPGGRFRVCLSRLEREELLASNQGYIFIRDASRDLGKIHIDKLSKDANNPPTFAFARREPRDSLVGVPMPKFADIDIDFTPDQARGKPILVCFWDMNQRPSRYLIKELAKKQERLKQDGLEVVCVQASTVDQKELDDWVKNQNITFPVGMVKGNDKKTRFNWGVKSLPWLLLTDSSHIVTAEGFDLRDLEKTLNESSEASEVTPKGRGTVEVAAADERNGRPIEGARVSFTDKKTGKALSQQGIAAVLRHQENLVRSMECIFDIIWSPSVPENIPLLYQLVKERYKNDPDVKPYIVDEKLAERLSTVSHWWRKGNKEREDIYAATDYNPDDPANPTKQNAFDGQIVRMLGPDGDGGTAGAISTPSGIAHWNNTNRTHPYSFLYQFQTMAYSQVIANGKNFRATKVVRNGKECTRVSAQHPTFDWRSFVLIYDNMFRLLEREVIVKMTPDPEPRIYERHVFSDYKEYEGPTGEAIWFPAKAVYRYYAGNLPNGTLVEAYHQTLNIRQIKFNVDIPDEKFALEFPSGIRVYDDLEGGGWTYLPAEPDSLIGKPLPKLEQIETMFSTEQAEGKAILLCFWDMNQRPSRHCVRELAKRVEELREEGIAIVCVQASKVDRKELDDCVKKYNVTFPVGTIEANEEKTSFNWGVKSLPWLILTDRNHIVNAEGFDLVELDEKIRMTNTNKTDGPDAVAKHKEPSPEKSAPGRQGALDLLDRYRRTQEALRSFAAKGEETSASTWEGRQRFERRNYEFKTDGTRLELHLQEWRDLPSEDEPTRPEKGRYVYWLWDGQCVIEHQGSSARVEQEKPGTNHVWVYKYSRDTISEVKRTLTITCSAEARLMGILFADWPPVDSILREAETLSMRDEPEFVGDSLCYVIEAQTKHGDYAVWIDPHHAYHIVRAEVRKETRDMGWGRPLEGNLASVSFAMKNVHFTRIDGLWVPMGADYSCSRTYADGKAWTAQTRYKRTHIDLSPDFHAPDAFTPDLPDGMQFTLYLEDQTGFKTTWLTGAKFTVDEQNKRVDYIPAEKSIRLKLVDSAGKPATGVKVGEHFRSYLDGQVRWALSGTFQPPRISDDNGQVLLNHNDFVWSRNYQNALYALHPDEKLVAVRTVSVQDLGKELTLVLHKACSVHGRLDSRELRDLGYRVDSKAIWASPVGRLYQQMIEYNFGGLANDRNDFEFLLPPGQFRLSAHAAGIGPLGPTDHVTTENIEFTIEVKPGQTTLDLGNIELPPTKTTRLFGKPAPELEGIREWKNGRTAKLADLRGNVVLLHFCNSDRDLADMRRLLTFYQAYPELDVQYLVIHNGSIDSLTQMDARIQADPELANMANQCWRPDDSPFRIALDTKGPLKTLKGKTYTEGRNWANYGLDVYPRTFLVDKQGILRKPCSLLSSPEGLRFEDILVLCNA